MACHCFICSKYRSKRGASVTSTGTIRLIRDGEKGGRRGEGYMLVAQATLQYGLSYFLKDTNIFDKI